MPFKKGQSGNPTGRRRGSPNRLTRTFREAMGLVFDRLGGEKHLLAWAKKYPTEYYRIKARMVPPGHTVNIGRLEASRTKRSSSPLAWQKVQSRSNRRTA